jgi:hypothetical protein
VKLAPDGLARARALRRSPSRLPAQQRSLGTPSSDSRRLPLLQPTEGFATEPNLGFDGQGCSRLSLPPSFRGGRVMQGWIAESPNRDSVRCRLGGQEGRVGRMAGQLPPRTVRLKSSERFLEQTGRGDVILTESPVLRSRGKIGPPPFTFSVCIFGLQVASTHHIGFYLRSDSATAF